MKTFKVIFDTDLTESIHLFIEAYSWDQACSNVKKDYPTAHNFR